MPEIKTNQQQTFVTTRKCEVCGSPTKDVSHHLCDECIYSILAFRTIFKMMKKDGLCFLAGFGDVEKEVKSVNV